MWGDLFIANIFFTHIHNVRITRYAYKAPPPVLLSLECQAQRQRIEWYFSYCSQTFKTGKSELNKQTFDRLTIIVKAMLSSIHAAY